MCISRDIKVKLYQAIQRIRAAMDCARSHQQQPDDASSASKEKETKMKFAQAIQQKMAAMGFIPNRQQNQHWQLIFRQSICIVKCSIDAIIVGAYVFYEAERIEEYMESIFAFTVVAGILIALVSIAFKNDKLFKMIETIAEETNFSKCSNSCFFLYFFQMENPQFS